MNLSCFVLSLVSAPHRAPFVFVNERNAQGKMLKRDPDALRRTWLATAYDEATADALKQIIEAILATEQFAKLSMDDCLVDLEKAIREAAANLKDVEISRQFTAEELREADEVFADMEAEYEPDFVDDIVSDDISQ